MRRCLAWRALVTAGGASLFLCSVTGLESVSWRVFLGVDCGKVEGI